MALVSSDGAKYLALNPCTARREMKGSGEPGLGWEWGTEEGTFDPRGVEKIVVK
jgi:hypothetical protein